LRAAFRDGPDLARRQLEDFIQRIDTHARALAAAETPERFAEAIAAAESDLGEEAVENLMSRRSADHTAEKVEQLAGADQRAEATTTSSSAEPSAGGARKQGSAPRSDRTGRGSGGGKDPRHPSPADDLSRASAPSPRDVSDLKVGKKLGSGGEKDVYAIEGRDDIALAVAKPKVAAIRLTEETSKLEQLAELGLPVVEVHEIVRYEGRPAALMKRYAQGSKTVVRTLKGRAKIVGESRFLNERSIADLERIRDALRATPVWINDLQFLIGEDGAIVIADVIDFQIGVSPSNPNLSTIARLIEAARSTIAKKGASSQ